MERNKHKIEETREIWETDTWNIAKCVANWKEKRTKSKQALKTDETTKQNERNIQNKTKQGKHMKNQKQKIQKKQSTDDVSICGHSIWHFEELKWIELWHVWGHFWNSLICTACFHEGTDVYSLSIQHNKNKINDFLSSCLKMLKPIWSSSM